MLKSIKMRLQKTSDYVINQVAKASVIVMSTVEQSAWYVRLRAIQATLASRPDRVRQLGGASIGAMLDFLIIAFIGVILLYNFTPLFESEAASANISNSTTSQFGSIVSWLLPVLGFLGIIYLGVRFVRGGKGGMG